MVLVIIFCFVALLWLGTAFMLGYCLYDCHDFVGRFTSFLLVCGVVGSVIECVLILCIGIARIMGYN